MRFGIDLSKATRDFEKPGHKYIRRVRSFRNGKMTWTYYYANEDDRQKGVQHVDQHKKDAEHAEAEHKLMTTFDKDQGVVTRDVPLSDLSVEYAVSKLGWSKPPLIRADWGRYHAPLLEFYEKDDPHGQPMSPMRALEYAFLRIPASAKLRLDGKLGNIDFLDSRNVTDELKKHPDWTSLSSKTQIKIVIDRISPWNAEHHLNGGMPLVASILREYGFVMYRHLESDVLKKWDSFLATGGDNEPGVTAFADASAENRFAETFAAACMYPQQLAEMAPQTYEWFRQFLGDEALPQLHSDPEELRKIDDEIKAAGKRADKAEEQRLRALRDRQIGILDREEDDPQIAWWKPRETRLQTLLRQFPAPNYNSPENVSKFEPTDKFYELSYNGRTLYMRVKASAAVGKGQKGEGDKKGVRTSDILEVYTEDGRPIATRAAWWHLHQDEWGDNHAEMANFLGFEVSRDATEEHKRIMDKNELFSQLWSVKGTTMPVEIPESEYRQRSGVMVLGKWAEPGAQLLDDLRGARPGSARHNAALAEYAKAQPKFAYEQVTVNADLVRQGFFKQEEIGQLRNLPILNPDGTPRLAAKLYSHTLDDGSVVNVECLPGDDSDPTMAGKWYVASPVWRALLTPLGEDVPSPEALNLLCYQATEASLGRPPQPRRAWVTVQADARKSDLAHFFHMQVEWDGKGLPKILGSEWKRRLGKDEPRMGDLIVGEGEAARVKGEKIRLEKGPMRSRLMKPKVGDRIVLKVNPSEMGIASAEEKEVIAVVTEITPGAKPGEETYVLSGEVGGGAGGKRLVRHGLDALRSTMRPLLTVRDPLPLEHAPLVYLHQEINPIDGSVETRRLHMLLPKDGSITASMVERLPGVQVVRAKPVGAELVGVPESIEIDLAGFAFLRQQLGGLSVTGEALKMINTQIDTLRAIEDAKATENHVLQMNEIDPAILAARGVGVNAKLSDGSDFTLAEHQQAGVQKIIDNDGRALIAHTMGTGKTVTAIVAAKIMQKMRDPIDPTKPHPNAPKRVLVVAPLNTVEQWRQEVYRYDEGALTIGRDKSDIPAAMFLEGTKRGGPYENVDFCIVGPEYFTRHQKELREAGFDGLIIDEAHRGIKTEKNERLKAVQEWNPDMKMLVLLTGTPVTTSPADMLNYVQLLSKDKQWGDMSRSDFENEYLEASDIVAASGSTRAPPKVQIKASKREMLGAILGKWTHVALAKDVKGKTLPAVRWEEAQHSEMRGVQAQMYALQMAALGPTERAQLASNAVLAADEMAGLGAVGRRHVSAAKSIANCPAFKPASTEKVIHVSVETVLKSGKKGTRRVPFKTFPGSAKWTSMEWLQKRPDLEAKPSLQKKLKGRWPPVDALTAEERSVYTTAFQHILSAGSGREGSVTYEEIAGTQITKAQIEAMKKSGWADAGGIEVDNPEAGPLGVRFRGVSVQRALTPEEEAFRDRAILFQNTLAGLMETKGGKKGLSYEGAIRSAAQEFGVTEDEALAFLNVHPDPTIWKGAYTEGGVTITTTDAYVSDTTGSQHLLFRKADWDEEANRPRARAGGFAGVRDLDTVIVTGKPSKYPFLKPPRAPAPPEELELTDKEEIDEWKAEWVANWQPGPFAYEERQGEDEEGRIAIRDRSDDTIYWVDKKDVSGVVKSIMDPGMRQERKKADLVLVAGNAKAGALGEQIERFFIHTGDGNFSHGPERARSMVIFANDILAGCRVSEAKLRTMGFRDVNEVLEGSPHYDPEDAGPAPNGKYFVTYIGATYTGDRELNIEISKKTKDKQSNDTNTSLFVDKTMNGRKWKADPAGKPHPLVQLSQWTQEQRERVRQQFKIDAPEAHVRDPKTGATRFFYGSKEVRTFPDILVPKMETVKDPKTGKSIKDPATNRVTRRQVTDAEGKPVSVPLKCNGSEDILRAMVLIGDPGKMGDAEAKEARRKLAVLQDAYVDMAMKNASDKPPLTPKQINVFNNCDIMVLSDAAQVGINKGDAVESIMYDSLSSPMNEMQRVTRSARMLPPAVKASLMRQYIVKVAGLHGTKFQFAQLPENPSHPDYIGGARRVFYVESGNRWQTVGKEGAKDAVVAWEKDGKILVNYKGDDGKPTRAWVAKGDIGMADGPFKKIKDRLEERMFKPSLTTGPQGKLTNFRIGDSSASDQTFTNALEAIANYCDDMAEAEKVRKLEDRWKAIASQARMARNLGVLQAKEALERFKTMKMPGKAQTMIGYSDLTYADPTRGTYALYTAAERARDVQAEMKQGAASPDRYHAAIQEEIEEPVAAIKRAIDGLSEQERDLILDAGYSAQGQAGSLDPTAVYLAIRAQEVMDFIGERHPIVAGEMRRMAGGKVVTDNDVMNRIIDELSPIDRAVLKAKKYLVNVHRLGVSGYVPRIIDEVHEDGSKTPRFVGYDRQLPVETERNQRVIGRARLRPVEQLNAEMQRNVRIRTPMDHDLIDHKTILAMRKLTAAVQKALRFVFNLARR